MRAAAGNVIRDLLIGGAGFYPIPTGSNGTARSAGDPGDGAVVTDATLACWVPAWRAARFDPISSLRND